METPNLNYIKGLAEGDKAFEAKLIAVLKKELPEELEEYLNNFQKKNFVKTAENVHKLKHKISILGLTKGYEEAALYENDLRDQQEVRRHNSFVQIVKSMSDFLSLLKEE